MTPVLVTLIGLLLVYGIYIASLAARAGTDARAFLEERDGLPGWAVIFAGAGVVVAGMGLPDYFTLAGRFGLQYSHTALGLIVAAMAAVLVQKRLWIAARVAGLGSPGEAIGRYYQSVTLRIVSLALAALFALPVAAVALSQLGETLQTASNGAIARPAVIWAIGFFLGVSAIIGGWRATILVIAMQALLLATLLLFVTGFSEIVLQGASYLSGGIPVDPAILADRIPGVVQYSAGIGKDLPKGGMFTAVAIASTALSLIGITLSPGFLYLGMTARAGRAFAFGPVWIIAGLGAGLLLFIAPFLVARLGVGGLLNALAAHDVLAAVGLVVLLTTASMIAVSFFVTSGALLITRELILPFVLPNLDASAQRLTARIALAVAFILAAMIGAFAPLPAAILASLALPLTAQLLPALLGFAFVPWISRSAVLTGLIIGGLIVLFTEPAGLILFERLFIDLPWGRWPLTVHSAAWGLAFNFAAVLLAAIFTRRGVERDHRDRLHNEFAARWRTDFGGPAARGAKWSLSLLWAFLAIGPGAILGNTFFSQPVFTSGEARLGIPSLWVWQMLFWLIGVLLVWWIAYRCRLGITSTEGQRRIDLGEPTSGFVRRRAPAWIASGLARLTER
jgi:SSS family solute:Na+ symporter